MKKKVPHGTVDDEFPSVVFDALVGVGVSSAPTAVTRAIVIVTITTWCLVIMLTLCLSTLVSLVTDSLVEHYHCGASLCQYTGCSWLLQQCLFHCLVGMVTDAVIPSMARDTVSDLHASVPFHAH